MATIINGGAGEDEKEFVIVDGTLIKYNGFEDTVEVPEGVCAIGGGAFSDSWSVGAVILPETVTEIKASAFEGCANIAEIKLPKSLLRIEERAFLGCTSFVTPQLPEGLESVGACAFKDCGFERIEIPESVTKIGEGAFEGCKRLSEIRLPKGVRVLPDNIFAYCDKLQKAELGDVCEIGKFAFRECKSLAFFCVKGDSLSVGGGAFADCESLVSFEIQGTLKHFGDAVFTRCRSLENLLFPKDTEAIVSSSHAFAYCESLREITLPAKCFDIKENAFLECGSLSRITVLSDSLIVTRGAVPPSAIICAPRIPISGFGDGSALVAALGFFMMSLGGEDIDEDVKHSNEDFTKKHYRDIMSMVFRNENLVTLHLELLATYALDRGYLTRKDVNSFLASPLLSDNVHLLERLEAYLETLPPEEKKEIKAEERTEEEYTPTVLERYLGREDFESPIALSNAILSASGNKTRFRELIIYVTENKLLDKESTDLLLNSAAAESDIGVRGCLIKYKIESFDKDTEDDDFLL